MAAAHALQKAARAGKNKPQIVTAVGRELLGFIWAIAVKAEERGQQQCAALTTASSMPAIPSALFVTQRRHPSRLPFGALRAALTGPGAAAEHLP